MTDGRPDAGFGPAACRGDGGDEHEHAGAEAAEDFPARGCPDNSGTLDRIPRSGAAAKSSSGVRTPGNGERMGGVGAPDPVGPVGTDRVPLVSGGGSAKGH